MTESARFWDRIAERYARKPVPDQAVYEKKLEITRAHLRPDMQVLEFGCGSGTTALLHAPFVRRIQGIDSSAKMIEIARGKAMSANAANASFQQASIEEYAALEQTFDAVLGLSILHLLDDWSGAIKKVHRLLKPGGVFVSSTACLGGNYFLLRMIAPLGSKLGLIPLVRFFTPEELRNALTAAGFVVEREWRPDDGRTMFIVARKQVART